MFACNVVYGKDFTNSSTMPTPDIEANGLDNPVTIPSSETLSLSISLDPGKIADQKADWWIASYNQSGWKSFVINPDSYGWEDGIKRCIELPLVSLDSVQIPPPPLSKGKNTIIFAVDDNVDGKPDATWWDFVEVKILDKCGVLKDDETWSGEIYVSCTVEVPEGVTLNIEPGTIVKFKYSRNYKTFDRAGLRANGGTIIAEGTSDNQIWFTSAVEDPINGDWQGISLYNTYDSSFDYVIVEFGEMGIEQFDSSVPVKNSIIRWNNAEGLYAERSQPYYEHNLLYNNGYHEIALEQYNTNVQIKNSIFHNEGVGGWAIHHEKTESNIEGNYFYNYRMTPITAGMESNIRLVGNRFRCNTANPPWDFYGDTSSVVQFNDLGDNSVPVPELNFEDIKNNELDYVPGDLDDRYPYIYAEEDSTRRILKKTGKDLGFGWALEYVDDYLYKFTLGEVEFVKIDPFSGNFELLGNDGIMNPRGLTYDGEYFYVNDFSLLKIFKFSIINNRLKVLDSFDIPDKHLGGVNGLASDGDNLYLRSRDNQKVYKLTKTGELVDEINMPGGSLVWTGEYFWVLHGCEKGLCKYTKDGELLGEIYHVAKDPWAIAWDGDYLWTIQRTCENWNDPKIYQIEILDDSLI